MGTYLFSSDFHGDETAFRSFALTLAEGEYSAGLLAGDLLDEWLPDAGSGVALAQALDRRRGELQELLHAAEKPIFFVLGNHDVTPWPDTAYLTNLHGRIVEHEGQRLTGYRWTRMDRYPHELEADLPALIDAVDERTILVTHSPPHGVLDGLPGSRFSYGLRTLLRMPRPRLHLFGHVHECAGVRGTAVNGSWPALRQFFAVDPSGVVQRVAPRGLPPRPLRGTLF